MQQEAKAPAGHKGPRVFMDYSQSELDAAYDQAVYAPNRQQMLERNAHESDQVRARIGEPERLAYGPSAVETLDVYRAKPAKAPIFVFIHGGAWRAGSAKDFSSAAETFVQCGVTFVVPDFVLVQDAGGSLLPMAAQVRRAIAWTYENAVRLGGDRDRLHVGGVSSGAHLAGCAVTADWQGEFGLSPGFIKGAMLCSGMYDLAPVRLSARSQYVKFTDEMVQELSPQRHIDRLTAPLIVAYGTCETPEFQRQSRDFAAAVTAAGKKAQLVVGEHYNHFEMPHTLANPFGLLGRAVLEQIGIGLIPA